MGAPACSTAPADASGITAPAVGSPRSLSGRIDLEEKTVSLAFVSESLDHELRLLLCAEDLCCIATVENGMGIRPWG
jgi:hypothetical protein